MPDISIIVAATKNKVIGLNNQMPWHLPADLAWFKQNTLNKPVVMGRKTFTSIGRLLPNRLNVILSRTPNSITIPNHSVDKVMVSESLSQALAQLKNYPEIMIIGGAEIFAQALPIANKLFFTEIQTTLEGDVFFPEIDVIKWEQIYTEEYQADEKNAYNLIFTKWQRR